MPLQLRLTKGQYTFVDDADYDWLSRWNWLYSNKGYALRTETVAGQRRYIMMHRAILQAERHWLVDHIDGNRLNNTRANLRLVTHSQNNWNRGINSETSSPYKGVSLHERGWYARIRKHGQHIHLGYFPDAYIASLVYDHAACYHFGEYAKLNHPHLPVLPIIEAYLTGEVSRDELLAQLVVGQGK